MNFTSNVLWIRRLQNNRIFFKSLSEGRTKGCLWPLVPPSFPVHYQMVE